jgi:sentrin-specific protease 1
MNITRHDFATLDGLNWLNDEVINFYMELIKERSEQVEHLPKVHVMNTFFLGKLLQNGHSGVRRWTRKVDIFSVDIIPIPVSVYALVCDCVQQIYRVFSFFRCTWAEFIGA